MIVRMFVHMRVSVLVCLGVCVLLCVEGSLLVILMSPPLLS